MKKVILGVLALIFAIALVTGGYLWFTYRNLQRYEVEEGVPCPYSWQELRDGTYRLKINTTAYPGYRWSVESYPKGVVAVADVSTEQGTAVFSILPLNMGETYVQVYCEQTEPFNVRVFEVRMHISVSEERTITVEKTEDAFYNGITVEGEDSAYPIQWWVDSDGVINLLIAEESNGSWKTEAYDPDGMDVAGPFYRQGSCGFEIRGKMSGKFPLTIYDGRDKAICLEIEVTEELTAAISGFAVESYTAERDEKHAALEAVAGKTVTLPTQAVLTGYSVKSEKGSVDFVLNDCKWSWLIAPGRTEEDVVGKFAESFTETGTATVSGISLSAYAFEGGVVVFWDDNGCAMVLNGESGVLLADALAVAGQIVEANNG